MLLQLLPIAAAPKEAVPAWVVAVFCETDLKNSKFMAVLGAIFVESVVSVRVVIQF